MCSQKFYQRHRKLYLKYHHATTVNLPNIPGGKKLIYTHIELPLTALAEFEKLGETDERFKVLDELVKTNNGLWCTEAERYLLQNF